MILSISVLLILEGDEHTLEDVLIPDPWNEVGHQVLQWLEIISSSRLTFNRTMLVIIFQSTRLSNHA